jgi:RNA polymerase sigma-70 factor (ECF subfamily)
MMPSQRKNGASSPAFSALVDAARSGSNEALGQLLDQWRNYLLLVANQELGDDLAAKAGASDVVQDAFAQAQQAFAGFSGKSQADLTAWLRQILLRQIFALRRQYFQSLKRDVRREESLDGDRQVRANAESLPDGGEPPDCRVAAKEDFQVVSRALDSLSPEYREIIRLRYWENLTFEEIGSLTGKSADAARKCWFRAAQKLARLRDCQAAM